MDKKTLDETSMAKEVKQTKEATQGKDVEKVENKEILVTREQVIEKLKEVINKEDAFSKDKIDSLKHLFYKIYKQELEKSKIDFIAQGNKIEDFVPENDNLENELKDLLSVYKEKRANVLARIEKEEQENLDKKKAIIEKIKTITDNGEDIGKFYNDVRQLQQDWKEIGNIPSGEVKKTFKLYQLEVEKYYDLLKINNEFRDYDFKKNLDFKTKLCESAESLLNEPDIVSAFRQLQQFHEEWRNIGPVSKELREDLWNRFKTASTQINKKHQEHFEEIKNREQKNLENKTILCENIEKINEETIETFKKWDSKTKEIIAIQKEWKTIGFAPKKFNTKIYDRFRAACDTFFENKSNYFKTIKEEQNNNYEQKQALCEKAESLKDSTDWKNTSDILIKLQKEWKTIGPVPRSVSDSIWKRFVSACDFFFQEKEKVQPSQKTEQNNNLKLKKTLIEEVNNLDNTFSEDEIYNKIKEYSEKWSKIGHVPFKDKDKIYKEWHEALNKHIDKFRNTLNSKKLDNYIENIEDIIGKGQNKVYHEQKRLNKLYETLNADIKTAENNIGFFSTKNNSGSSLLKEMENKIEKLKSERELVKNKIKLLEEKI